LKKGGDYSKMCYRKLSASEDEEIQSLNSKSKKKWFKDGLPIM
jgi:hypothetical protein